MTTLVSAQANETVCGLLYRLLKDDSDELVEEFYRLNPKQKTLFLDPLQQVILPELKEKTPEKIKPASILEIWE